MYSCPVALIKHFKKYIRELEIEKNSELSKNVQHFW